MFARAELKTKWVGAFGKGQKMHKISFVAKKNAQKNK